MGDARIGVARRLDPPRLLTSLVREKNNKKLQKIKNWVKM